ncbi:cell division protein FtsX [Rhodobium gokarnense]|uniref:Cell division transport system permease protein n=1 Tax=Rhodobium gokarnense TaxID=364296 RepID=A0ABT3HDW3_9HYPH|nr:ABC transporter permease [Rhodobium gokarnense]MCW2308572.1 cell division transport system permease protein [Rhodobium gokarnense]
MTDAEDSAREEAATPEPEKKSTGPAPRRRGMRERVKKKKRAPEFRDAAPIVPPATVAGNALAIVIAIMSFLACLTIGAVTVVHDASRDWQGDIAREVTVQIRPVDGVDMTSQIEKAIAIAEGTPGIATAHALSDKETKALLEPWLGAGLDLDALPVPRLVRVELGDPVGADIPGLKKAIADSVPGGSLDDHSAWTRQLTAMAQTMVIGGFVILGLVLTAMVLSVVFATRAAMAGNRDVIEVLHLVGAEDGFIAGEFQRHFLLLGLKGGAAGGAAAIVTFAAVTLARRQAPGTAAFDQLEALLGQTGIGALGYVAALGVVFVVAILTALTSRLAVRRTLGAME